MVPVYTGILHDVQLWELVQRLAIHLVDSGYSGKLVKPTGWFVVIADVLFLWSLIYLIA